jgi:type II secretion system protein I
MKRTHEQAFTFVEVVLALAIVSISMLTLLRLHLISIRTVQTAEASSQAVLLAQEKIAETLALGYPQLGSESGTVERNNVPLQWRTKVADLHQVGPENVPITGLREVSVDVGWKHGAGRKHVEMSTYAADRKLK